MYLLKIEAPSDGFLQYRMDMGSFGIILKHPAIFSGTPVADVLCVETTADINSHLYHEAMALLGDDVRSEVQITSEKDYLTKYESFVLCLPPSSYSSSCC